MSTADKLKERYIADTEMMASKSRFGYFSLLPSHTAAITDTTAPLRNTLIIQHIVNQTEKFTHSQEISIPVQHPLELSKRTFSHTLLPHFMAHLFSILENLK
jgi:hypothetical protein